MVKAVCKEAVEHVCFLSICRGSGTSVLEGKNRRFFAFEDVNGFPKLLGIRRSEVSEKLRFSFLSKLVTIFRSILYTAKNEGFF